MTEIVCGLLAAFSAVVVAVINQRIAREHRKNESRAGLRRQESLLSMEMLSALGKLCTATALGIQRGHCNGEISEGLSALRAAEGKYTAFLRGTAACEMSK